MFWSKNKKNRYTPANPSFTIEKWGLRGYSLHGHVFLMPVIHHTIQNTLIKHYLSIIIVISKMTIKTTISNENEPSSSSIRKYKYVVPRKIHVKTKNCVALLCSQPISFQVSQKHKKRILLYCFVILNLACSSINLCNKTGLPSKFRRETILKMGDFMVSYVM